MRRNVYALNSASIMLHWHGINYLIVLLFDLVDGSVAHTYRHTRVFIYQCVGLLPQWKTMST